MYRQANYLLFFSITAVLTASSLLTACTNDLKKIQEISQKLVNSPVDTTTEVNIIYSDSAKVKAQIFAPLMLEYQTTNPSASYNASRKIMPKGIKIIFYDNNQRKQGTITADTAYYMETQKLIKLRKNVVITSAKGDVFKSEELDWDQFKHQISSNKPVDFTMANGDVSHGTSFQTNEKFSPITLENHTGVFIIDSKIGD